jgi:replicative DNA helicase
MESIEFEQQLVGSMMIKGHHVDCTDIASKLPEEAFENYHLRQMYHVICSLLHKVEPIDVFSVRDGLPEGTKDFAFDVLKSCSSAANIKAWAKRVRQCWMLRKGKQNLLQAIELLDSAAAHNINDNITQASALISNIAFETNDRLPRKLSEILPDWLEVLDKRMKGSESGLYLKVGIAPLDEKYGGFDRTDLIVIAGQPGMGKTEIAIMMANYIGSQRGRGLFVSMEMSDIQVLERHIADRAGMSIGTLRNPLDMLDEQYNKLMYAAGTLNEQENYVLNETLSVDGIIAHAERMVMDEGLAFLCVDYLGLVKKNKAERNDLAIGEITRRLKEFSLRMNVPTILLSQLNREAAKRVNKRPIIQDLRDSGSIEQDADVIIFPYREEVHEEHSKMKGIAEIIVAKYRSGEPCTAYMAWKNGHFVNMDQEEAIRQAALAQQPAQEEKEQKKNWRS